MNTDQILAKLNSLNDNTAIKLNDGRTIHISDIYGIYNEISYNDLTNQLNGIFSANEQVVSLGKFLDYIGNNHEHLLSSTLHYSDARLVKSKNPIRNNGKWIYKEILFQAPLRFTFVKINNYIYIVEPMEHINSLISFKSGVRAISDTLGINNHEDVWWSNLDSSSKEHLLEVPVTILKISNLSQDNNKYIRLVSTLFDIPQYIQFKLTEQ